MSFFADRYATINFHEDLVRDFVEELKQRVPNVYRDMLAAVDTIVPLGEGGDVDEYVERVIVKTDNVDVKIKIVEGLGGIPQLMRKTVEQDILLAVVKMAKDYKPIGWVTDLRIKKALKCIGYDSVRVKTRGEGQHVWLHWAYKGPRDNHSLMSLLNIKPDERKEEQHVHHVPQQKMVLTTGGNNTFARELTKRGYVRVFMTGGGYVYVHPDYKGSMKPSELRRVMEAENGNE